MIRVILNPGAGATEDLESLRKILSHRLPEADVRLTQRKGDAREIAREALDSGVALVVAGGGDGTLNEVINGLAADFPRARLGLLPLGTGNDFARSIGVPPDLEGALAILAEGRARAVDVVRADFPGESRWFVNMSAGGFGGMVSEKAAELKDRWGPLAYLRAALGTLPEIEGFKTSVTLNGTENLEIETYNVVISNGRYVAAGIPAAPHSRLDDGLLDLMLVPTASLPELALLVPQVLLGKHTESDLLLFRKANCIEIESEPPMSFNVDGEVIGEGPVRFHVLPRALQVIVGPDAAVG